MRPTSTSPASAITQLNATFEQTDACVDKRKKKAVDSRARAATTDAFDTGRYSTAKRQYIKLLEPCRTTVQYDQCLFNLENEVGVRGQPCGPG